MPDTCDIPIQVISLCNADGKIQPLRFRYEDRDQRMHTVRILEIIDTHTVTYVGVEGFRYLCKAEDDDYTHLFELSYAFRSHRWKLSRILY